MYGRLQYMAQRLLDIAAEKERQRKAEEEELLAGGGGAHDVDDAASDWSRSQVCLPPRSRPAVAPRGGWVREHMLCGIGYSLHERGAWRCLLKECARADVHAHAP